jgi:branched-subunit amino acid aminotransferase/4-amino-4-deoxychorismate lyase
MENNDQIIFDGEFRSGQDQLIPVLSRGLLYGDGCFATFRSYRGRFLELGGHLDRLEQGVRYLDMRFPNSLKSDAFVQLLDSLLEQNHLNTSDAIVRIQVWRKGGRGYHTPSRSGSHYSVSATRISAEAEPVPVALSVSDIRRIPDRSLPSRFKFSNSLNYIVAARQARDCGADDALMLTVDGHVSETTIANVFWVSGNTVYTPSEDCDLLPGITRSIVMKIIDRAMDGVDVKQGIYNLNNIEGAEAVWICNSVRELVPVRTVNTRNYPTAHPVFLDLKSKFESYKLQNLVPLR